MSLYYRYVDTKDQFSSRVIEVIELNDLCVVVLYNIPSLNVMVVEPVAEAPFSCCSSSFIQSLKCGTSYSSRVLETKVTASGMLALLFPSDTYLLANPGLFGGWTAELAEG